MKVGVQELMAVLDEEQAEAVIDHRKKLKKPMTAYAAKLLAKRLSQFEDPAYAADYMIEKGWQSIELDWLPARKQTQDPYWNEYERWSNESRNRHGVDEMAPHLPADDPDRGTVIELRRCAGGGAR